MEEIKRERQGEIALAYLKYRIKQNGIPTLRPNEVRRKVHDTAKALGIDANEAEQFARGLVMEAINDCFPAPGTFHNESIGKIDSQKEHLPDGGFMGT